MDYFVSSVHYNHLIKRACKLMPATVLPALQKLDIYYVVFCVFGQDVASKMEVKAMPTFLLMREGAVVDKVVGANPEEIRKRIDGFVQSIRIHVA